MTQNGFKHILNMFLKSVTKTERLNPPSKCYKCYTFFLRLPRNCFYVFIENIYIFEH